MSSNLTVDIYIFIYFWFCNWIAGEGSGVVAGGMDEGLDEKGDRGAMKTWEKLTRRGGYDKLATWILYIETSRRWLRWGGCVIKRRWSSSLRYIHSPHYARSIMIVELP